jgi:hypothetical protein
LENSERTRAASRDHQRVGTVQAPPTAATLAAIEAAVPIQAGHMAISPEVASS